MEDRMQFNPDMDGSHLEEFEAYLDYVLTPVKLRVEFVNELKQKLTLSKPSRINKKKVLKYGVFGTAGFISTLILLATSIRAVIALVGAFRVLRHDEDERRVPLRV